MNHLETNLRHLETTTAALIHTETITWRVTSIDLEIYYEEVAQMTDQQLYSYYYSFARSIRLVAHYFTLDPEKDLLEPRTYTSVNYANPHEFISIARAALCILEARDRNLWHTGIILDN